MQQNGAVPPRNSVVVRMVFTSVGAQSMQQLYDTRLKGVTAEELTRRVETFLAGTRTFRVTAVTAVVRVADVDDDDAPRVSRHNALAPATATGNGHDEDEHEDDVFVDGGARSANNRTAVVLSSAGTDADLSVVRSSRSWSAAKAEVTIAVTSEREAEMVYEINNLGAYNASDMVDSALSSTSFTLTEVSVVVVSTFTIRVHLAVSNTYAMVDLRRDIAHDLGMALDAITVEEGREVDAYGTRRESSRTGETNYRVTVTTTDFDKATAILKYMEDPATSMTGVAANTSVKLQAGAVPPRVAVLVKILFTSIGEQTLQQLYDTRLKNVTAEELTQRVNSSLVVTQTFSKTTWNTTTTTTTTTTSATGSTLSMEERAVWHQEFSAYDDEDNGLIDIEVLSFVLAKLRLLVGSGVNPEPETRNPKPETLTLNPKP